MKRIWTALVVLLLVFGSFVPIVFIDAEESFVYVRKHISILYDNSGSMREAIYSDKNYKWCYASYAAQVFTGLMNDTDSLSITFMEGRPLENLKLSDIRQNIVLEVLERTREANADTPLSQISSALNVLEKQGMKEGNGTNDAGEQFWLVLTTDGIFRENGADLSADRVVDELTVIMNRFPDLHLVYFGINTDSGPNMGSAIDFRKGSGINKVLLDRLHSYPNFTAVYAENQNQIVSTMKELSNQISGRYSVPKDNYTVLNNQVRLKVSSDGAPIRNIALMAQETDAKLLSASAEGGTTLNVSREAQIRYPVNEDYDNVPAETKGGYVALITAENAEKISDGTVVLTFSEPINAESLSLMYEPAIHVLLSIERKSGEDVWEEISEDPTVIVGDEVRISYAVCENGTNRKLDTEKLFGKTEAMLRFNGEPLEENQVITISGGDSQIDAFVSMMDGGYQISTSRMLRVRQPSPTDFTVECTDPIEIRRRDVANNTEERIEFSVFLRGKPVETVYSERMKLEISGEQGNLKGESEQLGTHIFRFTPRDDSCKSGEYLIRLVYEGVVLAERKVFVLPNEDWYSAEAGPGISILSNEVAKNTDAVEFTVTAHRDEVDEPITSGEAQLFVIKAVGEDGKGVSGTVSWGEGGVIRFTPQDASLVSGTYTVKLQKDGEDLAQAYFSVIHHDADYSVETFVSNPDTIDRFELNENESNVSFVVYEDGIPCSEAQLLSMLDHQIFVEDSLSTRLAQMDVQVRHVNGLPAIVCTPKGTSKSALIRFFQKQLIAAGVTGLNRDSIEIRIHVDMEKGASAAGTLILSGYRIIYLIIPIAFLSVSILLGLFLLANYKARRLKKGVVWKFTMGMDTAVGGLRAIKVGTRTITGWGWKPMLMIPIDESHKVDKLTFFANREQKAGKQKKTFLSFRRQLPTVSFENKQGTYVYSGVSDVAKEILQRIRSSGGPITLMKGEIPLDEGDFFSYTNEIVTDNEEDISYRISFNSAMIYKKRVSDANVSYEVWVYEAE